MGNFPMKQKKMDISWKGLRRQTGLSVPFVIVKCTEELNIVQ